MQTLWNMNPICSGCEEGEDPRPLTPNLRPPKQTFNIAPQTPNQDLQIMNLTLRSLTDRQSGTLELRPRKLKLSIRLLIQTPKLTCQTQVLEVRPLNSDPKLRTSNL